MQDRFTRVSQDQLDLWLNDPVTQAVISCLKWYVDDVDDSLKSGSLRDPSNNDLTGNNLSYSLGVKAGLQESVRFKELLRRFELLEHPKEEIA